MVKKAFQARVRNASAPWQPKEIERFAPFGSLEKKKNLTISWQDIRPTIRWMGGDRLSDGGVMTRIIFDYSLSLFLDGTGYFMLGKERIDIQKRHLFLIPPFVLHSFQMTGSHLFTTIHFDWKPNFPLASKVSGRQPYQIRFPSDVQIPFHQVLVASDPLVEQLQRTLEAYRTGTEISHSHSNILLADVLFTLLKRAEMKHSSTEGIHLHTDQRRVEIAILFMQERLSADLSLEEIAQAAGLSISHFSRVFRQWTGHSPVEYLINLRLKKAKELLEDVHLTIKEVSNSSGFRSSSHFSMMFTRSNDVSPSQYREMIFAQRSA